ncbi:MAG: hypothetical protein K2P81_02925 [Bacteriovoracaceae bacterium]|nr:hypothetical protein [Bacteriovoracaceae bacterium]
MKWLLVFLITSNVFAADSSTLFLRARVPAIFEINITSKGEITFHSNQAKGGILPQIERSTKNGQEIITVTHP